MTTLGDSLHFATVTYDLQTCPLVIQAGNTLTSTILTLFAHKIAFNLQRHSGTRYLALNVLRTELANTEIESKSGLVYIFLSLRLKYHTELCTEQTETITKQIETIPGSLIVHKVH